MNGIGPKQQHSRVALPPLGTTRERCVAAGDVSVASSPVALTSSNAESGGSAPSAVRTSSSPNPSGSAHTSLCDTRTAESELGAWLRLASKRDAPLRQLALLPLELQLRPPHGVRAQEHHRVARPGGPA